MANELHLSYLTGQTIYVLIRGVSGTVYQTTTGTMVTYNGANIANYDVALTDAGGGFYTGTFPVIAEGTYYVEYFAQAGAGPNITNDIKLDSRRLEWDGTQEVVLADIGASSPAGAGAYASVITIQTTGSVAIQGVSLWITASSAGTGTVLSSGFTNSSGQFTAQLDTGTFYVFCYKPGYSFLANTVSNKITVSGAATHTLTIGTALSTGTALYYADSFLTRSITELREAIDEPSINAKYTDARCVRKLEEAYALVMGELTRVSVTPVVARHTITTVASVWVYPLPPTIGSVKAIYEDIGTGYKVFYSTYGRYNNMGRGVWLEGRALHLQEGYFPAGTILTVEYTGTAPRLCNGVCTVDSTGTLVTLGAVYQGTRDTRLNAYAGSVLRIIADSDASYNYVQERTITADAVTTGIVTLDYALSPNNYSSTGVTYFEIAPPLSVLMDVVVPLRAALDISSKEGAVTRTNMLRRAYWDALRNAELTEFYSDIQNNTVMRADNFDARRFRTGYRL